MLIQTYIHASGALFHGAVCSIDTESALRRGRFVFCFAFASFFHRLISFCLWMFHVLSLSHTLVRSNWLVFFFPSFGYVSIGGVTTDYIVSFSVLFYSEAAINHTYTQFFHNEKKISLAIQWPEMSFSNSVSIFSLAFSLFILSLFYLCLCF